ncbi:MAG: hypothetical protein M1832_001885 [Thelocarpon impressellum]|nr:MAG: hypothetical protein M1832_001885 [Thelocarpon impressellum]
MANSTLLSEVPLCPRPFLPESNYPDTGGFIRGRFCGPVGSTMCCLPCPQTNWVYGDHFHVLTEVANYINVVGVVCCGFVLLSFAILPVEKTHRHYLSVCLVLATVLMHMGFIIPLGTRPKQCYNDITPNDMFSSLNCAMSGAFLLAVFMRALTLHLQICWQVITGRKFFICALLAGWGIPAAFVTLAMSLTGVSYRFGNTCHINHSKALQDFWGPLLAFAGATMIIQFATFGFCIKVYLQSLMEDGASSTTNSSALPSFNGSVRTASARQAYRRVRRIVELQWRGITIVILILADVVFFSVVFVYLDNTTQQSKENLTKARPWLFCLITNKGDKNKCLDLAASLAVNEATVMAVLILLSMNGIWCIILLGRWSMVTGWGAFLKQRFQRKREFVSVDARRFSKDPRTYEMLQSPPQSDAKATEVTSPEPVATPRQDRREARVGFPPTPTRENSDYFGQEATYSSPHLSFSAPRAPAWKASGDWDATATYAKGGGLSPRPTSDNRI